MSWLKKLFHNPLNENWEALAQELDGEFEKGTWRILSKIHFAIDSRPIILDRYSVQAGNTSIPYTRLRAGVLLTDDLRFHVYRQGLSGRLAAFLGMQDINTGFRQFDDAFMIKGNDEPLIRKLFDDEPLRETLLAAKEVDVYIHEHKTVLGKAKPDKPIELWCQTHGFLSEKEPIYRMIAVLSGAGEMI